MHTTTGNSIRLEFSRKRKAAESEKKGPHLRIDFLKSNGTECIVGTARNDKKKRNMYISLWLEDAFAIWNDVHLHLSVLTFFHGTKFMYSLAAALAIFFFIFLTANFVRNECAADLPQTCATTLNGKQ